MDQRGVCDHTQCCHNLAKMMQQRPLPKQFHRTRRCHQNAPEMQRRIPTRTPTPRHPRTSRSQMLGPRADPAQSPTGCKRLKSHLCGSRSSIPGVLPIVLIRSKRRAFAENPATLYTSRTTAVLAKSYISVLTYTGVCEIKATSEMLAAIPPPCPPKFVGLCPAVSATACEIKATSCAAHRHPGRHPQH